MKAPVSDFRSDTVTIPSPEMRAEMAFAPLGDDVYGEDPTINLLQTEVASLCGKEAGLFVSSGTQGNLICAMVHCETRGSELICGDQSHMYIYEQGGVATLAGIHSWVLKNQPDGTLPLDEIALAMRPADDVHYPKTRLICLENTQNRCGGRILTLSYMQQVAAFAREKSKEKGTNVKVHLDGARLWNASIATGVPIKDYMACVDSATVCFSKGLACPVGSVIVGTKEFVEKACRWRKALGGGMRQAGTLAAPCLFALFGPSYRIKLPEQFAKDEMREESQKKKPRKGSISKSDEIKEPQKAEKKKGTMVERLAEDHANAKWLAHELALIPGVGINPADVETNILMVSIDKEKCGGLTSTAVVDALREHNILVNSPITFGISPAIAQSPRFRLVTHFGIEREDCVRLVQVMKEILKGKK